MIQHEVSTKLIPLPGLGNLCWPYAFHNILPLAYLWSTRVHHLSPTPDCNVFHFPSEPTLAQHHDFLCTLIVHSNCTEENEASLVYFISLQRGTPSPFPRAFFLHKIQTCKELERMLFIMTKANMQIFGVIPFFKLQYST